MKIYEQWLSAGAQTWITSRASLQYTIYIEDMIKNWCDNIGTGIHLTTRTIMKSLVFADDQVACSQGIRVIKSRVGTPDM